MIFEVECYTTKDELTDRTHTRIVSFIVLDEILHSVAAVTSIPENQDRTIMT